MEGKRADQREAAEAAVLTRMLLFGHANHQLRVLVLQQQVAAAAAREQRFAIELPANAGHRIAEGIAFQHKGFAQFDCLVLWGHYNFGQICNEQMQPAVY